MFLVVPISKKIWPAPKYKRVIFIYKTIRESSLKLINEKYIEPKLNRWYTKEDTMVHQIEIFQSKG